LLYESIVGRGFEYTFLKERSGFHSVMNFNVTENEDIKLSFEFDKTILRNNMQKEGYQFPDNPIYEMVIFFC